MTTQAPDKTRGVHRIIMRRTGGPEALELVEEPAVAPKPGEILVQAHAIGVGWPDILIRKGVYRWMPPLPASPGSDLAGRVAAVGLGVDAGMVGKPVLVTARELPVRGGCYADEIVVPATAVFMLPEGVDLDLAVCLPNYQVAWNLVHEMVVGRAVRSLFINGAAGGIGSAAAQLAKAAGMTVFGSVSSPEKAAFARAQGVDHAINYRTEDVVERVLALSDGRGVDLAIDHVGGAGFSGLIRMLADWGTLVSYNANGGLPDDNLLGALRAHGARCPAVRVFEMHIYDRDRDARRRTMQHVIDNWAAGRIAPHVSTRLPLAEAARAHELIEHGDVLGKVILKPHFTGSGERAPSEMRAEPVGLAADAR